MMTARRLSFHTGNRGVWALCGLIVVVIAGTNGYLYRMGREHIQRTAAEQLDLEFSAAQHQAESALESIYTNLSSWAHHPTMERILDGDLDNEIAEFLDELAEQYDEVLELHCFNAEGALIYGTAPFLQSPDGRGIMKHPEAYSGHSEPGLDLEGGMLRFTMPVKLVFDEEELIGELMVLVDSVVLIHSEMPSWLGVRTSDGSILVKRGPGTLGSAHPESDSGMTLDGQPAYMRQGMIKPPEEVNSLPLELVLGEPMESFLEPLRLQWVMAIVMSLGTTIGVIIPVILFTRRQRGLLLSLDVHAQQLKAQQSTLVETNRELDDARTRAEQADRSKSDFLANMSHEIRTPMTAILGFTDLLMDPLHNAANFEETVQTIRRNGEHLLTVINDILDLSKMDAGRMSVERVPISPHQIIEDVVSLMQVRASGKGLQLRSEYLGPIPETIQSDPTRLRQILLNLVGNAIKFTEHGGIRLAVKLMDRPDAERPRLRLEVIDTGIGLSEKQIAMLFQPFAQADSSTTRKFGGTGLGLTISRNFAELLGGDITITSIPGEGSTFSVMVSTGSLDGVRLREGASQGVVIPSHPEGSVHPSTLSDKPLEGWRILLVEDGPDNQRLISFHLKKAGGIVDLAENGQIGLDKALAAWQEERPYAVILMDMQMPVMDGYTATGELRRSGYRGAIVALTAHAMAEDRQKCLDAGCDDYTTKPIDKAKLIQIVGRYAEASLAQA